MKCPYCSSSDIKVVDKRDTEDGKSIRRRRECLNCGKRFTTYERVDMINLIVVKKDGRREQFDRDKLKLGIIRACEKRPVSADKIESIVSDIEARLRNDESIEISSERIGELVMSRLKRIDKVAYIRFASVYREFADLEEFEKELAKLVRKKKKK
ncbi:transcriptional repressor NrdR [Candidatus Woesearchaeota archaeon]|nr:MAG: transcriptional repressor NrdR [Candidatus Woesearchaeota archaeon]